MANHLVGWMALALAAAGAGLWLVQGIGLLRAVTGLLLALGAVAVACWLSRVVAARRLRAAANTYAERALAHETRQKPRWRSATRGR
jgi:hypothetical protein